MLRLVTTSWNEKPTEAQGLAAARHVGDCRPRVRRALKPHRERAAVHAHLDRVFWFHFAPTNSGANGRYPTLFYPCRTQSQALNGPQLAKKTSGRLYSPLSLLESNGEETAGRGTRRNREGARRPTPRRFRKGDHHGSDPVDRSSPAILRPIVLATQHTCSFRANGPSPVRLARI
jgi:hypothetical protein